MHQQTAGLVLDSTRPIGTVDGAHWETGLSLDRFIIKAALQPSPPAYRDSVQNVALTDQLLLRTPHLERHFNVQDCFGLAYNGLGGHLQNTSRLDMAHQTVVQVLWNGQLGLSVEPLWPGRDKRHSMLRRLPLPLYMV